jgi:hypothetical protein
MSRIQRNVELQFANVNVSICNDEHIVGVILFMAHAYSLYFGCYATQIFYVVKLIL